MTSRYTGIALHTCPQNPASEPGFRVYGKPQGSHAMDRRVVVICGPPGSGKTTWARQSGLTVYDRDDPGWASEKQFRAALSRLAHNPAAQAAVIRAGATRRARKQAAELVDATDVIVLDVPAEECQRRIRERKASGSMRTQMATVTDWWSRYEPGDISTTPPERKADRPRRSTTARGYGAKHKHQRSKAKRQVIAGQAWCWRCGEWIHPDLPWDLGHDDHDRSIYRGPEHRHCNRATALRGGSPTPQRWQL